MAKNSISEGKTPLNLAFSIIKDGGEVVGFGLNSGSGACADSQYFCLTFDKELREGRADIELGKDEILFAHPEEGSCSFKIGKRNIELMRKLLKGKLKVFNNKKWDKNLQQVRPGFKAVMPKKAGVETEAFFK